MNITLHSNEDIFDALAPEWNSLIDPERSEYLFLCRQWQRIWWKHLHKGKLAVVTVRDDENVLRGIGSWFIHEEDGKRIVHFVGCEDVTDYMDFIAQPGYEELVIRALIGFMLSDQAPQWDVIDLCNIPQDSLTSQILTRLAQESGLEIGITVQDVCPVIELPGSYEDYLMSLDKKQRHELRRKRRRVEAETVDWYIVGPEHDLDAEIDYFLSLMALSTSNKAEFLKEPGHQAFFREMGHALFDAGTLELMFLRINGERAAVMWQFAYHDRLMLYNSGLDPHNFSAFSPGIVLSTYSIEHAIQRGIKTYDFLRGDEVYKYRMGAQDTQVLNIVIRR